MPEISNTNTDIGNINNCSIHILFQAILSHAVSTNCFKQ